VAAVLAVAGLLGWHSLTDLDIWFHLRAGRDLLAGHGFGGTNGYGFLDAGYPWLNHEWLFQAVVAGIGPGELLGAGQALGWNLLRLLLALTLAGILLMGDGTWRLLRGQCFSPMPAVVALATLAGLLMIWTRLNLRPELLSYILFVLVVRAADAHYRRPAPPSIWRDRSLWRLGALVLVWAQCHGFAALGPAIILLRLVLRPFDRQPAAVGAASVRLPRWPWRALVAPVLVGVTALLATPNLWRGLWYPLTALGQLTDTQSNLTATVSELVPLFATPNALGLTILVFKLSLVWAGLVILVSWPRPGALRVALVVATAVAAAAVQRNLALYGLAFVLLHTGLAGPRVRPWWRAARPAWTMPARGRPLLVVGPALLVLAGAAWWGTSLVSNDFYLHEGVGRRFGDGCTPAIYPVAAAKDLPPSAAGRTFANLDAAAYVLGATSAQVLIDGRTEAYPPERWADHARLRRGGDEAIAWLDGKRVSAVVLALGSSAFTPLAKSLLGSTAWHLESGDAGGLLFLPAASGLAGDSRAALTAMCDSLLMHTPADATRGADFCLIIAQMYELADEATRSRQILSQGLTLRPDHPVLNHNLGLALMTEGDFATALGHFQRARDDNPRLAGSDLNAGVCELRLRRPQAAVKSFRRSLATDPQQIGAWVNLAVALRGSGHPADAVKALEEAVALRPDDTRLQAQLQQWRRETP
jgi:tetratricopeptide (TPR) repeat protein